MMNIRTALLVPAAALALLVLIGVELAQRATAQERAAVVMAGPMDPAAPAITAASAPQG
jgi:hypothetical protein